MNKLFIVIHTRDLPDINDENLKKLYRGTKHIISFEKPNTNPHYHVLLHTDKSENAIRNAITRKFDIKGGDRTVAHIREYEKCLLYVIKEHRIVSNTLLTDEEMSTKLQEATVRTNLTNLKKAKKQTFKQKFILEYKPIEYVINYDICHWPEEIDDHIAKYIRKMFVTNVQLIDRFIIDKFTYTLKYFYYPKLYQILKNNT